MSVAYMLARINMSIRIHIIYYFMRNVLVIADVAVLLLSYLIDYNCKQVAFSIPDHITYNEAHVIVKDVTGSSL